MRGNRSSVFSSGSTTSMIATSPVPSSIQRQSVAAVAVAWTRQPWRESAREITVRIPPSSSARITVGSAMRFS